MKKEPKVKTIRDVKKFQKNRVKQLGKEFELKKIVAFPNETNYRGIVVIKNINISAKCEHHLVSIRGKVHIGFIPHEKLIGLSQIPRIIENLANPTKEIIQEKLTKDIIEQIMKYLNPIGAIVVVDAVHDCMSMRGVKQMNARTITSEIRGVFWHESVKSEFFELLKVSNI